MASHYPIPSTPRVISPSPTPTETSGRDGYFGPVTRSVSRATRITSPTPIQEDADSSGSDPDKRARTRSRSPILNGGRRGMSGFTTINPKSGSSAAAGRGLRRKQSLQLNGAANGHLSPESANKKYWRELSRSPSPLGLIPIHQKWRSFIHRHEIPRKILHVSIGFLTTYLYVTGVQTSQIHPILLTLLIPIAATDYIRHQSPSVNHFYIRCLGALMRESEVDGWNGVIWYLLGAFVVLRFFPKDVGAMGILLLSWCDTAASTFGRLWGRYTPRVRKGKSLAGSIAAMLVGVGTAALFYGWLAPTFCPGCNEGEYAFAFQGALTLPVQAREILGWSKAQSTITGGLALGIFSVVAGFVAAASEAVDLFGWDDNLTIPVLSAAGLWGFLKVFG